MTKKKPKGHNIGGTSKQKRRKENKGQLYMRQHEINKRKKLKQKRKESSKSQVEKKHKRKFKGKRRSQKVSQKIMDRSTLKKILVIANVFGASLIVIVVLLP